jgi:large subunit ribosomal protein L10
MKREQKHEIVKELKEKMETNGNFYLADVSCLSVNALNQLRQMLYEKGITIQVVKNTLVRKALEESKIENEELKSNLTGPSSIIFCDKINEPAKIIKTFRESHERPLVKMAYLEETLYVGDDKLNELAKLKSKEDLIADVLQLLQSPMTNLINSLNSSKNNLGGILKSLSERQSS